jgi:ParB family chromosome partitioning protein
MDRKFERKGLGRGLSSLLADVNLASETEAGKTVDRSSATLLPIESIVPNPDQPRRNFDRAALEELAASIRAKGIIQPIVVRPMPDGTFQIVAGERRWRAAQLAMLHVVPSVVKSFTDDEVLEIAIIENIQRQELSAIEEAAAFRQLMDRFGHTQEQLSEALGKSRSHVANTLRLLNLPESVQDMVRNGKLTAGHARALLGAPDPHAAALEVIGKGLSVRGAEELAKRISPRHNQSTKPNRSQEKDADTLAIERDLSANLGMSVSISHENSGEGGRIQITYRTLDQLDRICQVLSLVPRDFTP